MIIPSVVITIAPVPGSTERCFVVDCCLVAADTEEDTVTELGGFSTGHYHGSYMRHENDQERMRVVLRDAMLELMSRLQPEVDIPAEVRHVISGWIFSARRVHGEEPLPLA